ncbi:MAG: hypothetical protein WBD40_13265 [Tepidisphaeraceae bacterium]
MTGVLFAIASLLSAAPPTVSPDRPTVIVVVGAEGEAGYGKDFATWADRWVQAAQRGNANVVRIGRDSSELKSPGLKSGASAEGAAKEDSDKQRLKSAIESELISDHPAQPLWLILIGHGTFDGREAKFNLSGPDVSDEELTQWLQPCKRPLAVVNCASASAPFLTRLSAEGRVIITATRAGNEINVARFGDHLSLTIADPSADLDKDGQTSLLEAFLAASHRVAEFYAQQGRLQTEHALLDDNGDKLGIGADFFAGLRAMRAARDGAPLDGPRSRQWNLVLSPAEQAMSAERRAKRDELELAIESLRQKKATMDEANYYGQLEPLLLELAKLYASSNAEPPGTPGEEREKAKSLSHD